MMKSGKSYYVMVKGHRKHIYTAGEQGKPCLVFMSASAAVSPVYDFRILYDKLEFVNQIYTLHSGHIPYL